MPSFFKKFINQNKSEALYTSAGSYVYSSNPAYQSSVLPPANAYPQYPDIPNIRGRSSFSYREGMSHEVSRRDNPFADQNRAYMSSVRRSRSQTFFSEAEKQLGPLLHEEGRYAEKNQENFGPMLPRRRANSATRPEPGQIYSPPPLQAPTQRPFQTKEQWSHHDDSDKATIENKGKAASSDTPTSPPNPFVEQSSSRDNRVDDSFPHAREEFERRYPSLKVYSPEEIAEALRLYEQFVRGAHRDQRSLNEYPIEVCQGQHRPGRAASICSLPSFFSSLTFEREGGEKAPTLGSENVYLKNIQWFSEKEILLTFADKVWYDEYLSPEGYTLSIASIDMMINPPEGYTFCDVERVSDLNYYVSLRDAKGKVTRTFCEGPPP